MTEQRPGSLSTKTLVIAALWVVAIVCFAVAGFDPDAWTDHDLHSIGLAFGFLGLLVNLVWAA